ncbi:hypothetical protein FDH38_gp053 [Dinoroseobacter phage vB_DshS-R5C]|uniref:Uncharacterized protein n=1 Tax=Dinoroseobacter phage vB_DshS-R5C TaxID=1965368 RepID=A0A1V0DYA1_9CAUD|nr:hypothetical protein FDH38_gp053 [Dinoroseobacter phage vB_DshS-R5C]ARB06107.1 hypothetical protein vBDshSR5C_53 [Dinoroseobacter phage vB_DshS-R5C]
MPDDLSHIEQRLEQHTDRITALELWKAEQATFLAVREERDKHLDRRFDKLEQGVDEVKGYLLKIVWVIVLGILGSLVMFIINGGLAGV